MTPLGSWNRGPPRPDRQKRKVKKSSEKKRHTRKTPRIYCTGYRSVYQIDGEGRDKEDFGGGPSPRHGFQSREEEGLRLNVLSVHLNVGGRRPVDRISVRFWTRRGGSRDEGTIVGRKTTGSWRKVQRPPRRSVRWW